MTVLESTKMAILSHVFTKINRDCGVGARLNIIINKNKKSKQYKYIW